MGRLEIFARFIVDGLIVTIELTIVSAILAVVAALVAGSIRNSKFWPLRAIVTVYVEIFRGTSCYVQLFWFFYALPLLGVTLSPFVAASTVLGLNVGAYGSEVVRGALRAVPNGQREAAIALNYSKWQRFIYIELPLALRIAIPPATNLLIDLLKLTPLTSLVTIADLTYNSLLIRQQTGYTVTVFTIILIIYFILSSAVVFGMKRVERHFQKGADGLLIGSAAK